MRTTVTIDDGLLTTAKQRAQEEGKTLGDLVESALQRYLLTVGDIAAGSAPPLPVFRRGTGMAPGIDPASNASLAEAMYAEEDAVVAGLVRGHERP